MPQLTFFRQKRYDGGFRMGLEIDGLPVLTHFEEGPPNLQEDPLGSALLWYIDITCAGESLPTEPEVARAWFEGQKSTIYEGMARFADAVGAGTDDDLPLQWSEFPARPADVEIRLVCSTIRRVKGPEFSEVIRETASHLVKYLKRLSEPVPVAR